jgi:hypothetical protein
MDIIIKIRIPEGEYKGWDEFEKGGIDLVKKELSKDLRYHLDSLGVDGDLEIITEE